MYFELKGKLLDTTTNPSTELSNYTIKAYDEDPFPGSFDDDLLGSATTAEDGSFKISFNSSAFVKFLEFWDDNNAPDLYLKIYDVNGEEVGKITIDSSSLTDFTNPSEVTQSEAVVIGSGFGGTITSLALVNKYFEDAKLNPSDKKKIILLERGQWWVSHELPVTPSAHDLQEKPTVKEGIREFLEKNNFPYRTWPYPDNLNGLGHLINNIRNRYNRLGLLDYRISDRVHTLTASGVGGGSLIYTNVTEEPLKEVVDSWKNTLGLGIDYAALSPYFDIARGFLGVNKIVTVSSMGDAKLPRAKAFHDVAMKLKKELPVGTITNEPTFDPSTAQEFEEDIFAADLSITDIPFRKDELSLFSKKNTLYKQESPLPLPPPEMSLFERVHESIKLKPQLQEKLALFVRKYFEEQNACQRQGRCAIGCIPGARHTNNKKLFDYLNNKDKKPFFEVRALSDVFDIEPLSASTYNFKIHYTDFGAKKKLDLDEGWSNGTETFKIKGIFFQYVEEGVKKSLECKTLVLAAGAIGSTEILLKSQKTTRTTGLKLNLSKRLGKGYSTNGDLLGVVTPTKANIYATRGPMVTSTIRFKEGPNIIYTIEDTGIPKIFSGISNLLSRTGTFRELLVATGSEKINQTIDILTKHLTKIALGAESQLVVAETDLNKTLILSGMGTDSHDGEISLQNSWESQPNRKMDDWNVLDVDFDLNKLVPLYQKLRASMTRIATEIGEKGSSSFTTPLWDPKPQNIQNNLTAVVHNLGGCCIGKDRDNGVVNEMGQVYDANDSSLTKTYNSFYVIDGAIIPTSLGINPSLTISALAFKIAENLAGASNLPVEKVTIGTENYYFSR